MIESVQERQRGGQDFAGYYDSLCALQDTCPIPAVKAHLTEGILDINGDRIRAKDWEPIMNSIRINRNIHFISIRSYYQLNLDETSPDKKPNILRAHIPSIRDKDLSFELAKSLRDCLKVSENLQSLELQGLHLRVRDCRLISKGISQNSTLRHLSLEYSKIGDEGAEIILEGVRQAGNVSTLNLTGCGLTSKTGDVLGALIKYQAMCRHNSIWQESLRYRRPNLDTMAGLRRITLNENPLFEDRGAMLLAESLKDDLWVKAVDLQQCGLTNVSCRAFLGGVLKFNSTLIVLDLRNNPLIDRDLLRAVTEQVLVNGDGKQTEHKWLKLSSEKSRQQMSADFRPSGSLRKYSAQSKSLHLTKRPVFKPAGPLKSSRRSRSADSSHRPLRGRSVSGDCELVDLDVSMNVNNAHSNGPNTSRDGEFSVKRGLPWRTAARATRYKGYPPDHIPGRSHLDERMDDVEPHRELSPSHHHYRHYDKTDNHTSSSEDVEEMEELEEKQEEDKFRSSHRLRPTSDAHKNHIRYNSDHQSSPSQLTMAGNKKKINVKEGKPLTRSIDFSASGDTGRKQDKERAEFIVSALLEEFATAPPLPEDLKELKIEVVHLRRQLQQEQELRGNAEKTAAELRKENQRIQRQLDSLRGRQTRLEGKEAKELSKGDAKSSSKLDEELLDTIEQSFQQFHAFLDLLRSAGLGRVVTAAGMDNFTPVLPKSQSKKPSGNVHIKKSTRHVSDVTTTSRKHKSGTDKAKVTNGSTDFKQANDSSLEQSRKRAHKAKHEADRLYAELKASTADEFVSTTRTDTTPIYYNSNSSALVSHHPNEYENKSNKTDGMSIGSNSRIASSTANPTIPSPMPRKSGSQVSLSSSLPNQLNLMRSSNLSSIDVEDSASHHDVLMDRRTRKPSEESLSDVDVKKQVKDNHPHAKLSDEDDSPGGSVVDAALLESLHSSHISEEIDDNSRSSPVFKGPSSALHSSSPKLSTRNESHTATKSNEYPFHAPVFSSQKSMDAVMELETDSD